MSATSGRLISIDGEEFAVSIHLAAVIDKMRKECDRLRSLSESRRRVLVSVEWFAMTNVHGVHNRWCPACRSTFDKGHAPSCELAKAIAE